MSFKRMEGFVGSIPQAFIDRNLTKCPLCGSNYPHWAIDQKMEMTLDGTIYLFQCEQCKGVLSTPVHDVSGFNNTILTGTGLLKKISGKQNGVIYMKVYDAGNNPDYRGMVGKEYTLPQMIQMAESKVTNSDDTPKYYKLSQEQKPDGFCPECGCPVSANAAMCPECGFPFEQVSASVTPHPSTAIPPAASATMKNCPECGSQVSADVSMCPECGFPFEQNNTGNFAPGKVSLQKKSSSQTMNHVPQVVSPVPTQTGLTSSSPSPNSFEVLYDNSPHKIQENIPVVLEKLLLIKNKRDNSLSAHCFFISLTDNPIIAMMVDVSCSDIWENSTGIIENFQYIDLHTKRDFVFGQTVSIPIQNTLTRSVDITVKKVMFSDHTTLEGSPGFTSIPDQDTLESHFENKELSMEFKREIGNPSAEYVPMRGEKYWRCACGAINCNEEKTCYLCKCEKEKMFALLDPQLLRTNLDAYKEEQRLKEEKEKELREQKRLEEKRRKEEEEKKAREEEERRLEELKAQKEEERKKTYDKLKKASKIIYIAAAAVVAVFLFVYLIGWHIVPFARYLHAKNLMKEHSYADAYFIFISLGDFSDSEELAIETRYQRALYLASQSKYEESSEEFKSLDDYKDSKDQYIEARYQYGLSLMEKKEWSKAREVLKESGDYKDSKEQYNEASYQYGLALMEDSEWDQAADVFSYLGQYKYGHEQFQEACYQKALKLMSESKWGEAADSFNKLGKYKDSEAKRKEARYQFALEVLKKKDYEKAVYWFNQLGSYKDSKTKVNEAKYGYVLSHKDREDETTYKYLKTLKKAKYKDSAKIYNSLYAYKVSIIINDSESNNTTKKSSISKYHKIYCHLHVAGGPPDDPGIYLKYTGKWPDGDKYSDSWKEKWYDDDTGYCYFWYNDPAHGKTGTFTVYVYNKSTGSLLGKASVKIT